MRSSGKTSLQFEISKLVVLLIKYSKHAKHLSMQNKKLRIDKLELKQEIEKLYQDIEDLHQAIENIQDNCYYEKYGEYWEE